MKPSPQLHEQVNRALARLSHWKNVLTLRHLGSRPDEDMERIALREMYEMLLTLRVEVSALSRMMLDKGICSETEMLAQVLIDADTLSTAYEQAYPGFRTTPEGVDVGEGATETARGWNLHES